MWKRKIFQRVIRKLATFDASVFTYLYSYMYMCVRIGINFNQINYDERNFFGLIDRYCDEQMVAIGFFKLERSQLHIQKQLNFHKRLRVLTISGLWPRFYRVSTRKKDTKLLISFKHIVSLSSLNFPFKEKKCVVQRVFQRKKFSRYFDSDIEENTYVDRSAAFFLAPSALILTFFFLFAARFRYNLRVAHVQRIFLKRARSFCHSATTERRYELCERVWFSFVLVLVHFLQFRVFKGLL